MADETGSGFGSDRSFGSEFSLSDDIEKERELQNRERERNALSALRDEERPGRFGMRSSLPEESILDRVGKALYGFARLAINRTVPGGPVVGLLGDLTDLVAMKAKGMTDDEINNKAGQMMLDFVTGGTFSSMARLGPALQRGARALGAQGGPQSFATDRSTTQGARDVNPYSTEGELNRNSVLAQARNSVLASRGRL